MPILDVSTEKHEVRRMRAREGMRRYRARIKENEDFRRAYLEKDATRKKIDRTKQKEKGLKDESLKKIIRKKETERKRKYRQKIKTALKERQITSVNSNISPYKSRQTLGKALKKVEHALPKSPTKKLRIIMHLTQRTPDLFLNKSITHSGRPAVNEVESKKVIEFYCRDDISRQAPGKRDTKSVKDEVSGKRKIYQKRHMIMTIKEAYFVFKRDNPESSICLSKFYDFRPKHVLLSSEIPHNVCVCRYHANFNYIVQSIHEKVPSFPQSSSTLLDSICCDTASEVCMMNNCTNCDYDLNHALLPLKFSCTEEAINLKWKQWQDFNGRPQITITEGPLSTGIYFLEKQLNAYKTHCFVKHVQEKYFDSKRQALSETEVLIQLDFAENYSLISQDEIQSAHWSHQQVTIFTCVAWFSDATHSFAIISNELSHNKYSVYTFVKEIITQLKIKKNSLQKVTIFSDGCAAQFKNRYTLSNLCFMEDDYGVTGEWNFFASSHGKGAVDAVGGLIKRLVWNEVRTRRVEVTDAYKFYICALNKTKNIYVIYIDIKEVNENTELLNSRWEGVKKINKIQSKHHFKKFDNCTLLTKHTIVSVSENCVVFVY